MRLFAIGDIHGCSIALDTILSAISLLPGDRLITLGDYINKGPDSRGVLRRLERLYDQGWLIPLKGNHELKLLEAGAAGSAVVNGRILVDPYTLSSYGQGFRPGHLSDIPESHWRFVKDNCLDWWEAAEHFFVHATALPDRPLAQQPEHTLFWSKFDKPSPHMSGKVMVCGHTRQVNGRPANIGHGICIDTWACGRGWLTCLEVNSGKVWQTNQQGLVRLSHIDDYYQPVAIAS